MRFFSSSPSSREESPRRNAGLVLWLALLLVPAALYFAFISQYPVRRAAEALRYPGQLDAEEGYLLGQALRAASGKGLYPPISRPPYVVDNYPPLYPALWALAARWTGPSLSPGRWIALGGSLLAALAIAAIVFGAGRAGPIWRAAALACLCACLFFTSAANLRWIAYARVDLLSAAFSLWGLAVFALWGRGNPWARAGAALLFALAFFTKQTSVLAPLACLLWLFSRDRKTGLHFLRELAIALVIPFAALAAMTNGQFFLHTVIYNRNAMHWGELRGWAWQQRALYAPLLAALCLLAAWALWRAWPLRAEKSGGGPPLGLLLLYFLLSALSLLSLAKAGAAENYLLEPTAATAVFLGVALAALFGDCEKRGAPVCRLILAVGVLLVLWHAGRFQYRRIERVLFETAPRPNLAALLQERRIVREMLERPGPALAEDPLALLRAGKPILFQNFIMTQLAAEGKWNPAPIVEMAERGELSLIAAHQDLFNESQFFNRYPPALRAAVRRNYRLVERLDRGPLQPVYLYAPSRNKGR